MISFDFISLPGFYPLLAFWLTSWLVTKIASPKNVNHFDNNAFLMTLGHVGGMSIAAASLYFNDDDIIPETLTISWFASFFIADLWDCLYRKDAVFTVHALMSLTLCQINCGPKYLMARTSSKGSFTELSSPFYTKWKKTKSKVDFQIFTIIFFFCRLVWVPYFLIDSAKVIQLEGISLYGSVMFFIMQVFFFLKMLNILINYKDDGDGNEKKKDKKSE
jgi:hypothetical protein